MERKWRNICERYNRIREPYKFWKKVKNLSRKKRGFVVLKQDKDRGIVVIETKKYTEKCVNWLHTDSFIQLYHDLTKGTEGKI